MKIRGILFDVNGTLIDIHTEEWSDEIHRNISCFLMYEGISLTPFEVREQYYRIMDRQRMESGETHPEFDAVTVWQEIICLATGKPGGRATPHQAYMARFLAEMYRSLSLRRLQLYPDVIPVLESLAGRYKLAVVSDGQRAWAVPEMRATGVQKFFAPMVISGDYGFRKPDERLFDIALSELRLSADEVIFVGNDMYRDVFGAGRLGIKTVFFSSNQGKKEMEGVSPDYIIYRFSELNSAIEFLENS